LKLDELFRSIQIASDRLIDIEGADEEDLERLQAVFSRRAEKLRANGKSPAEEEEDEDDNQHEAIGGRNAGLTA
jgi:hypothetical protein